MPLKFLDEAGFSLGMIRDVPSWQIPPGGVYDSLNMIYDQIGVVRMRKGSTAAGGGTASIATSLGFVYSEDATKIEELYCLTGKTGVLTRVSLSGGGATGLGTIGTANYVINRPVRHFGFTFFPGAPPAGSGSRNTVGVAGQTTSTTFTNAVAASVTAGDPQVTLTGADVTTNVQVGAIVKITDTPLTYHYARVVSIDTTKKFTIWPAPAWTNAAVAIGGIVLAPGYQSLVGGACGASFQNRLLYGNTNDHGSTGQTLVMDRRVYYSPLPTEFTPVPTPLFTAGTLSGASFVEPKFWPLLNYFDVPGSDPVIAMEPVSGNQLLILTRMRPVLFSGNLTTQLATTSPTISFDISEVPGNGSCISDLGVQRTDRGVVWAGFGGIYAWNGREPVDLTDKKINTYWRAKVRGSSFALHGSAYVRNHYIVSYISGGVTEALCVNLSTLAWTRFQNPVTDMFLGVPRPTDSSQVYSAQWWDQSGTAPTWAAGQIDRLESIFDPDVAATGGLDSDGTNVNFNITTRPIVGDPETQKIQQRCTLRYTADFANVGSPSVTVTAQSKIDAADIDAASVRTLGTLSGTISKTVLSASNASPIVVGVSGNHFLQDGDYVDINGILGNLNANGRWRVIVVSGSSFNLIGSSGSGAYTSGGTVKKLTETDYLTSSLDPGQAVSFNLASATRVSSFQLQGIRLAFFEKHPVMSA